jgi:hypothetical protein
MNENLQKLLLRLKALRGDAAQFVFFASIYPPQMIAVRNTIVELKKNNPGVKEVDFIMYSPGGSADDAYRIIRTLRKNFETVNVIIPFWAKSAATLLSLGANKIVMDEFGEFGPLDAQIGKAREDSPEYDRESALNDEHSVNILENRYKMMFEQMYIRLYNHREINIPKTELSKQLMDNLSKFFKPLLSQIDPYKLGEKKRKLDIGAQYAKRIIAQFGAPINESSGRQLVDYLINECPDHGYVIDKDVMEKFVSNIHDSNIFGEEYKDALQELSLHLIDLNEELELIGIVDEPSEAEKQAEPKGDEEFAEKVIAAAAVSNDIEPLAD